MLNPLFKGSKSQKILKPILRRQHLGSFIKRLKTKLIVLDDHFYSSLSRDAIDI